MNYHMPSALKKILVISFILLGSAFLVTGKSAPVANKPATASVPTVLKPTDTQLEAGKYVAQYLQRNHYRKVPLSDSLSQQIFQRYLETLDGNRSYFLADEVEALRNDYGNRFVNEFVNGRPYAGFAIYNQFLRRAREKMQFMKATADTVQFDFSRRDMLLLERKNSPWPANRQQLQDLWRKELKYQWLAMKYSEEGEKSIRTELSKTYANRLKLLSKQTSEDAFHAYMYAITTSFDPHTNYFSPDEFESFQIDLSGAVEGIGAKLQMENEYIIINEVIPGGPAFKSNQIKKSDKIIGVGQGRAGEIVDVRGWRTNDVVKLIRGPKGTVVRLRIYPASHGGLGQARIVQLVRDKVNLQEQAASMKIIERGGRRIGVITIPSFYLDFEAQKRGVRNHNSTTRDVARILRTINASKVDGVIIDLRDNGGGSLEEAVNVTGLFIPGGPVVQISNSSGGKMVLRDNDKQVFYRGPLGVLVNRYSASASEIFAAAIQDYARGVVIGERTFGKGTVQSLVKLNQQFSLFPTQSNLGQLKLTIAKFYRISGSSTQHKGVTPDIAIPSLIDTSSIGEDSYTSSLPWSTISSTFYRPVGSVSRQDIAQLRQMYRTQAMYDKNINEYMRDLALLDRIRKRKSVYLNESVFKAENNELKRIEKQWTVDQDTLKSKTTKTTKSRDFMLTCSVDIMSKFAGFRKSHVVARPVSRD